jgi:hypothetical protein
LYFAGNKRAGEGAIYAASFEQPTSRVRVMTAERSALYARGANGNDYLLWRTGQTLMAQQFDARSATLLGEPQTVANAIQSSGPGLSASVSMTGLLVYRGHTGVSDVIWLDRTGKSAGAVVTASATDVRPSPDGRRLAVSRYDGLSGYDLWLADTERGTLSRFTADLFARFPVWSPNGRTIVFGGGAALFRKETAGGGEAERLGGVSNLLPSDWSPNGQFLMCRRTAADTREDLWLLPVTPDGRLAAGQQPVPYIKTPFNESQGRFSPEAGGPRWVAYQSDETGRSEVYIASFPEPLRRIQITNSGGAYPEWSADGRELFYESGDNKLMAVTLTQGGSRWHPLQPRELFPLPPSSLDSSPYASVPDGRRFAVRRLPRVPEALDLIVNWPRLLRDGGHSR